jgi:hypothetical protein
MGGYHDMATVEEHGGGVGDAMQQRSRSVAEEGGFGGGGSVASPSGSLELELGGDHFCL